MKSIVGTLMTLVALLVVMVVVACAPSSTDTPTPIPTPAPTIPMATQAPPPTPPETAASSSNRGAETAPKSTPRPLRPPTPLPLVHEPMIDRSYFLIPSLDRQIVSTDVIVLAEFVSAAAGTETIPKAGEEPTYRPKITMTFNAVEYLKGSGPNTFSVELRDIGGEQYWEAGERYNGYLTQAKALEEAQRLVRERNTDYDNRSGVLFLKGPVTAASSSGGATAQSAEESTSTSSYNFNLFNAPVQGSYTVDVDSMSRAWLPVKSATGGGSDGASGASGATPTNPTVITNTSPPAGITASEDPSTMTLAAIKTRIREIDAMIAAGDGSRAYYDCIVSKLTRHEYYRGQTPGTPWNISIPSGVAPEQAVIYRSVEVYGDDYHVRTTSGEDAVYFETRTEDDDSFASNGYHYVELPTRPLAAGDYTVKFHLQHHKYVICGFNPTDTNYSLYNVTVPAPAGTLHEAFFDPVTIGAAVGADATNGVLKPTAFTVGQTSTEISSLKWENNQVVLTLSPNAALNHLALDFIELDGSVSLTLNANDAAIDATAGTHTWPVTTQPWHDGDLLMLRIREVKPEG